MSIAVMSRVWAQSQAKGASLLVLLAISDFADDQGYAFPARATLAKKARITERAVQLTFRELERLGELQITPNGGPRGCNVYRIIHPAPNPRGENCSGEKTTTQGGEQISPEGENVVPPGGELRSPKPSVNRQISVIEPPSAQPQAAALVGEASDLVLASPSAPQRRRKASPPDTPAPAEWSDAMKAAWGEWLQHRRELRAPLTATAARQQIAMLAKIGEGRALRAIEHSIGNNWRGIFEPATHNHRPARSQASVDKRFAGAF